MKKLVLEIFLSVSIIVISAGFSFAISARVSQIRIFNPTNQMVNYLIQKGYDVIAVAPQKQMDLFVTKEELEKLKNERIKFKIIHSDYYSFIEKRFLREKDVAPGSMGGFHTYDEVVMWLDNLHNNFSNIVSAKFSIGNSLEGRAIWAIKISDNVNVDEDEPEVFYNALIHAREPQGMECLLYFMDYLTSNYGIENEATNLVNSREMYFIPIVNPDGYVYNQTTHPNGGGDWRKNRRGDGTSVWGVDLNRNYGYEWGYDNNGSSSSQSSETYRGPSAFSEPETQAYRDFVNSRHFKTALNYHTYSNLLIRPYAYDNVALNPASDLNIYDSWGSSLTEVNGYQYGDINSTVGYAVNGNQDDWCYGDRLYRGRIFSFTPEVGSYNDGFWPAPSRIVPLAQENLSMNKLIAEFAGVWCSLAEPLWNYSDENGNGYPDAGESGQVTETITNKGLDVATQLTMELKCLDPATMLPHPGVTITNPNITIPDLQTLSSYTNSSNPWQVQFASYMPSGTEMLFVISVESNLQTLITKNNLIILGAPQILFSDEANNTSKWNVDSHWDTTTSYFHSSPSSFTDSPLGNYSDNTMEIMTLKSPLQLSGMRYTQLRFWTRWDIETSWDFAQVQISSDDGTSWQSLAGKYTKNGSGNGVQTSGEPGYDGSQLTWVEEKMDLSSYKIKGNILIRFILRSDSSQTGDGWYIDDIKIEGYHITGTVPAASSLLLFIIILLLSILIISKRSLVTKRSDKTKFNNIT